MVMYIISKAFKNGKLKEGMDIVEATSGNTGISISAIGKIFKCNVHIFMPDYVSVERVKIMKSYGANVVLVSKEEGGFNECIKRADEFSKKVNGFKINQFDNMDNVSCHYDTTAREIENKLPQVNSFIAAIGTGGTLIGTGKYLKEKLNSKVYAIEPDKLSVIGKNNNIGIHKIQGVGNNFIPSIFDLNIIDDVILVNDEDSINMSRLLGYELGLGVGISSGANMLGAILLNDKINNKVVTVFPDDNKKYLSTELMNEIDTNIEFISNKIKLIDYEVM